MCARYCAFCVPARARARAHSALLKSWLLLSLLLLLCLLPPPLFGRLLQPPKSATTTTTAPAIVFLHCRRVTLFESSL